MIRTLILSAVLALLSLPAMAQQTLLQGGPTAVAHAPMYTGSGNGQPVVQDSGPAGGGKVGLGMSEGLYVARGTGTPPYVGQGTGPLGTNWCDYDAPITNATGYHYLCLSPNVGGAGMIAYGHGGGAAAQNLAININGTSYEFPFVLSGVVGPPTSVIGDIACWNNTTGTLLSDCGPRNGSFNDNLVATGTNQGTALLMSANLNAFITVASGTGSILQTVDTQGNAIAAGFTVSVINSGANPVSIYPPSGQTINGGSANAAVTVYLNAEADFVYRGAGAWYAR